MSRSFVRVLLTLHLLVLYSITTSLCTFSMYIQFNAMAWINDLQPTFNLLKVQLRTEDSLIYTLAFEKAEKEGDICEKSEIYSSISRGFGKRRELYLYNLSLISFFPLFSNSEIEKSRAAAKRPEKSRGLYFFRFVVLWSGLPPSSTKHICCWINDTTHTLVVWP